MRGGNGDKTEKTDKKSPLFFTGRIKIDKVHLGRTKKYVTY